MLITICHLTTPSYVERKRTVPNPLEIDTQSGSIICLEVCLSVCPVVCSYFAIFVFSLIFSAEVQCCDAFIPTLGSRVPSGECPSVPMSVGLVISISIRLYEYLFNYDLGYS